MTGERGGAYAIWNRGAGAVSEPELLALHKSYAKQAARRFPTVPQLGTAPAKKREDETVFLV